MAKGNARVSARETVQYCDILGELAFDVYANSAYAHYMHVLDPAGRGAECGTSAAFGYFSMSYSAFQSMRLFYRQNHSVLNSHQIESFLRRYREFSTMFSSGWGLPADAERMQKCLAGLKESYENLEEMLRETTDKARQSAGA